MEKILPYFIRHYEPFCDRIIFYDNMSTDSTREIIQKCGKSVLIDFDTGGKINQFNYLKVKNEAYKRSRGEADYVIVADIDEFLYHPQVKEVLQKFKAEGVTLPRTLGHNMVSLFHPRSNRNLTDLVRRGRYSPMYSKRCIFDPYLEINYLPGAHVCKPQGKVVESQDTDLKLLHYHYLGLGTALARYRAYQSRLSEQSGLETYSVQYRQTLNIILARFLKNWLLAKRII